MKSKVIYVVVAGILLVMAVVLFAQNESTLITPAEALNAVQHDSTIVLLDVRTAAEFNGPSGHLAHALLIPVQELERRVDELKPYKDRVIIVYCRTGHRSTAGTEILQKHGYHTRNMQGGITRWNAENLPVVKEKQ